MRIIVVSGGDPEQMFRCAQALKSDGHNVKTAQTIGGATWLYLEAQQQRDPINLVAIHQNLGDMVVKHVVRQAAEVRINVLLILDNQPPPQDFMNVPHVKVLSGTDADNIRKAANNFETHEI